MKKTLLSLLAIIMAMTVNAQTTYSWTWEDWDGVVYDGDNQDGSVKTKGSDVITFTKDGFSIVAMKASAQNVPVVSGGYNGAKDLRVYANGSVKVSNTTAMKKLVFTVSAQGKKRLTDLTPTTGSVTIDAANALVTWTGDATEVSFTVGEKATYGTDGSSKAGQFCVDDVTVYTDGAAASKQPAGLKFTPASVTVEQGAEFTAPVFTKATTAAVTFTTEDDEVASVDANGVITLGGELGVTTITATCEANDEFEAGTATCVITVNPKAQVQNITCAEAAEIALALTENNVPTTEVYRVTGYVTDTNGNLSRGQQIFWLADAKDGGKVFEGYWCNIPEGEAALAVGDKVAITGNLMKYNTTPEMKNGDTEIIERSSEEVQTIVATAAEAFAAGSALADGESTKEFYDVTAYVEEVTFNFSNGTESFKLTDVKGQPGTGLLAYKTHIAEAVVEGAKVRVVGKIKNYSGTIEFDNANAEILDKGDVEEMGGLETFENGGFEEWVSDSNAKGWKSTTTASNATVSKSEDSHTGSYAACIKNTTSNMRLASKEFLLPAGWYTFEFYAKSATETLAEARPGIAPWNAAENKMGSYKYGEYTEPLSQTEWTLVSFTFQLEEETQINLVVMNPKSTAATETAEAKVFGDLLVDDATFRAATEAEIAAAGINGVTVEAANDGAIYNVAGQRVSDSFKGIVIKNGKKYMVK